MKVAAVMTKVPLVPDVGIAYFPSPRTVPPSFMPPGRFARATMFGFDGMTLASAARFGLSIMPPRANPGRALALQIVARQGLNPFI
jgi:hypothetical protein